MGNRPPSPIEVFGDVRCPFAHVGLRRLFSQQRRRGSRVPVRVRAWPLEVVNGAALDANLIAEEVATLRAQVAPDLFTGFDPSRVPATSLPARALTAGAYAVEPDVGTRVALALRLGAVRRGPGRRRDRRTARRPRRVRRVDGCRLCGQRENR
jgi:hypothetical protein